MGMMRFRVSPTQRIRDEMAQQAYLSGLDQTSWPVPTSLEGDTLILQRSVSDSANLHMPWPVEGHGQLTLASGSLMERPEPYWLPLELARGTIVQLRNQLSDWQVIGLAVPPAVDTHLAAAVERLCWRPSGRRTLRLPPNMPSRPSRPSTPPICWPPLTPSRALAIRCRSGGQRALLLGADFGTPLFDPLHFAAIPHDVQRGRSAHLPAQDGNHGRPLHLDH